MLGGRIRGEERETHKGRGQMESPRVSCSLKHTLRESKPKERRSDIYWRSPPSLRLSCFLSRPRRNAVEKDLFSL